MALQFPYSNQPSQLVLICIIVVSIVTIVSSQNSNAQLPVESEVDNRDKPVEKRSPWENKVSKNSDENIAIAVNGNAILSNLDSPALIRVLGGHVSKKHGTTYQNILNKYKRKSHHHHHSNKLKHSKIKHHVKSGSNSTSSEEKGLKYHLHLRVKATKNLSPLPSDPSSITKKPKQVKKKTKSNEKSKNSKKKSEEKKKKKKKSSKESKDCDKDESS